MRKLKMKNKKKLLIFIILVALLVFIALFFIYYYRESSLLTSDDKKWISENGTKVIDIEVFNDVAVYGMDGEGVIFNFLDFVENKKCISYASSFGKTNLDSELDKNLKTLLNKYSSILVREKSAKEMRRTRTYRT